MSEETVETTEVQETKPAARAAKPKGPVFEPALGRIVLYTTGEFTVRPAIITRVNEGTVDLGVFNSQGCVPAFDIPPGDAETPGTYFTE